MDIDKATSLLSSAVKGFHGKFKKMYGQICVRVDDRSYLSTGGNNILSGLTEDSFELCDINTGGLGEIFRSRRDINAIIFGCSPDIVKVSKKRSPIPVTLEDLAQLTGRGLFVIDDAAPKSISEGLRDVSVCLIKGIGALAVGSNCRKAVAGIQIVEKFCEAELHGKLIGGTVPIDGELADSYRQEFITDYTGRNEDTLAEYSPFNESEFAKRVRLIEFGQKLVNSDLAYGSWGNLSERLNYEEMLITPSSMDYFDIEPEDIVRVNINTLEYGSQRIPSSETMLHAEMYRRLPDCEAIIHTHSNGISVFAACEAGFALGEGELQELIGDVKVTKSARAGTAEQAKAAADTLETTHACIIPHHGAVFYGPSLDVVFAVAEAVEVKARNLLGFSALHID